MKYFQFFIIGVGLIALGCGEPLDVVNEDTTAPSFSNLNAVAMSPTRVTLHWSAPGDDGDQGTADRYVVRFDLARIDPQNFSDAALVPGTIPPPQPPGTHEIFNVNDLLPDTVYWFALAAFDEANNMSPISVDLARTPPVVSRF